MGRQVRNALAFPQQGEGSWLWRMNLSGSPDGRSDSAFFGADLEPGNKGDASRKAKSGPEPVCALDKDGFSG